MGYLNGKWNPHLFCNLPFAMAAAATVYRNVNAANYPDSRPLTPLITTNAFDIFGHVLCRVSKFVPREFAGSPTGPSNERKKRRSEPGWRGGRVGSEVPGGRQKRRFVPFGSASTSVNAAGLPRTPRRTHWGRPLDLIIACHSYTFHWIAIEH